MRLIFFDVSVVTTHYSFETCIVEVIKVGLLTAVNRGYSAKSQVKNRSKNVENKARRRVINEVPATLIELTNAIC